MPNEPDPHTEPVADAPNHGVRKARGLEKIRERARALGIGGAFAPMFFGVSVLTLIIQLNPAWREVLIFERGAFAAGEWWRLWTGNLVHFGWPHFLADTAFFLIIGCFCEGPHPVVARLGLVAMPAAVIGAVYLFDPKMVRYAGLSGINVGFLVFLALEGWQKSPKDWLWAAALGLHVMEVTLEAVWGHGMVVFDDATIRVATIAHVGGAAYGIAAWAFWKAARR